MSDFRSMVQSYAARAEAELRDNILPFWLRHAVDRENGGFVGEVSNDLVVRNDVERGALLSSRILWTFSAAFRALGRPEYLTMARWAYSDLLDRFWDQQHGGLFWSASRDRQPIRTRKQVYGQAFGIYALTEYYLATHEDKALARAKQIYALLEEHSRDRALGGYFEAFTREWARETDVRLSAIDMNEPKSQNTHLHVMEAYTNLLRVWPSDQLRETQRELIEVMLTRILDSNTWHLGLFFTEQWELRNDRVSFGHDIEAAWLLHEAAQVVGDSELLRRVQKAAVEIARVTLAEGIDRRDGSLFYEAGPQGLTNTTKEWWPQAEAAVGFLDAYQICGDKTYLTTALGLWDFIEQKLVDRKNGEWFRAVSAGGADVSREPKLSFWKCPYHNGRACLELTRRLRAIAAQG